MCNKEERVYPCSKYNNDLVHDPVAISVFTKIKKEFNSEQIIGAKQFAGIDADFSCVMMIAGLFLLPAIIFPSIMVVSLWHLQFLYMKTFLISQCFFFFGSFLAWVPALGIVFWDYSSRYNWIIITTTKVLRVNNGSIRGYADITTDSEVYEEPRYGKKDVFIGNMLYYDELEIGLFKESRKTELKQIRMYLNHATKVATSQITADIV